MYGQNKRISRRIIFNPRARVERDIKRTRRATVLKNFNPRAHVERDPVVDGVVV